MNRRQIEELCARIVTAQMVTEDEEAIGGVRLTAVMIADVIAETGFMEAKTFLKKCGIEPKTFRKKASYAHQERYEEVRISQR